MAGYYCHINGVSQPSPHNLQILWEMRNGDLADFVVVEAGNMLGVSIPLTGSAASRKATVVAQLQSSFQDFIDRANAADVVLAGARQLIGVNYPAAP